MPFRELTITTPDGLSLEGVAFVHEPPQQPVAILLVHQYSLLGGNMGLMMGMARKLHQYGYNCLTFNCRGVGKSTGRPTVTGLHVRHEIPSERRALGRSEVEDVLSAVDWIREQLEQEVVIVASSAGAPIAGSAVPQRPFILSFIAIGYTFGRLCSLLFGSHFKSDPQSGPLDVTAPLWEDILQSEKPKLFIMGAHDGFTSRRQLTNRLKTARGAHNELEIVPGAGHFELESSAYDDLISASIHRFICYSVH